MPQPPSPKARSLTALLVALAGVGGAAAAPGVALAHGDSGGLQLPADAPAVTKDGEAAKAILAELDADPAAKEIAKDPIARAKRAISRAHGAKNASDEVGATLLSRLALELANDAKAVVRAAASEKKANQALVAEQERKEKVERTRALLNETQAHRGQVVAELEKARADAKDKGAAAAKKEDDRVNKKKPGAPAAPAPKNGAAPAAPANPPAQVQPPKKGSK